ncbi:branched-chain amino acid aminotransferase II [Amylocystis lapponica]|nr:branched-chain amino acid aminotransferase II [Amylocystis lapponica]
MAILQNNNHANGNASVSTDNTSGPPSLDASKLTFTLTQSLKPVPPPETLKFGHIFTDYMLVAPYTPTTGWSAPKIKLYGDISLNPASPCFHHSTNVLTVWRLFRPDLNMTRLQSPMDRVALPPLDTDELVKLIKSLVKLESRWIPTVSGHSLYIRPTVIGTRSIFGVGASDHSLLYVILSPSGPFFRTGAPASLLAMNETVRAWPGGTGGYKLSTVTEAGAMNFMIALQRDDGVIDVVTAPLDGTILPGVTRNSCLALAAAHPSRTLLPGLPETLRLHPQERAFTVSDLFKWSAEGRLLETFAVGTAAIVAGVGRTGYKGKDVVLPPYEGGRGPVAKALYDRILDIQEDRVEWEGWGVVVEGAGSAKRLAPRCPIVI